MRVCRSEENLECEDACTRVPYSLVDSSYLVVLTDRDILQCDWVPSEKLAWTEASLTRWHRRSSRGPLPAGKVKTHFTWRPLVRRVAGLSKKRESQASDGIGSTTTKSHRRPRTRPNTNSSGQPTSTVHLVPRTSPLQASTPRSSWELLFPRRLHAPHYYFGSWVLWRDPGCARRQPHGCRFRALDEVQLSARGMRCVAPPKPVVPPVMCLGVIRRLSGFWKGSIHAKPEVVTVAPGHPGTALGRHRPRSSFARPRTAPPCCAVLLSTQHRNWQRALSQRRLRSGTTCKLGQKCIQSG